MPELRYLHAGRAGIRKARWRSPVGPRGARPWREVRARRVKDASGNREESVKPHVSQGNVMLNTLPSGGALLTSTFQP